MRAWLRYSVGRTIAVFVASERGDRSGRYEKTGDYHADASTLVTALGRRDVSCGVMRTCGGRGVGFLPDGSGAGPTPIGRPTRRPPAQRAGRRGTAVRGGCGSATASVAGPPLGA